MTNQHEAAARARKSASIALALRAHLTPAEIDAIPRMVGDEALRERIGQLAKVRTPSEATLWEALALLGVVAVRGCGEGCPLYLHKHAPMCRECWDRYCANGAARAALESEAA